MTEHGWFAAWVVVGCALALGTISFAIGPFVFLPAAVIAVLMFRSPTDLNPLPWLALGLTFVVGGLVAYRVRRH